jgi:hypothetical protein
VAVMQRHCAVADKGDNIGDGDAAATAADAIVVVVAAALLTPPLSYILLLFCLMAGVDRLCSIVVPRGLPAAGKTTDLDGQ